MSRRFSKNRKQRERIAKRILSVVERTYKNDAQFLEEFNMKAGTFGNLKEKGMMTIEFLIEFADAHHKSLDWLLRKVGPEDLTPSESKEPTD